MYRPRSSPIYYWSRKLWPGSCPWTKNHSPYSADEGHVQVRSLKGLPGHGHPLSRCKIFYLENHASGFLLKSHTWFPDIESRNFLFLFHWEMSVSEYMCFRFGRALNGWVSHLGMWTILRITNRTRLWSVSRKLILWTLVFGFLQETFLMFFLSPSQTWFFVEYILFSLFSRKMSCIKLGTIISIGNHLFITFQQKRDYSNLPRK